MKKLNLLKMTLLAVVMMVGSVGVKAQYDGIGTFIKITSVDDLTDGYYVIVNSTDQFAMSNSNAGKFFDKTDVTPVNGVLTNPDASIVWEIKSHTDGGYTIYNEVTCKFVSYSGTKNEAHAVDAVTAGNQRWNVSYATNVFTFSNAEITNRMLQYNSSSPRFACYTTAQQKLLLYKLTSIEPPATPTGVYTSEVTHDRFTANWNSVEGATAYDVHVYTKEIAPNSELIKNGDFEAAGSLESWVFESEMNQTLATDIVHSGSSSLKVNVNATKKITQFIDVVYGKSYKLSFWYYLDPLSTGNGFRVWTTDGATIYLPSSGYFNEKGSWQYVEHTFIPDGYSMNFEIRVYNGATLYLDDISIILNDDPITDVPLFGSPYETTEIFYTRDYLNDGITYYYTVSAKKDGLISQPSEPIAVTTTQLVFRSHRQSGGEPTDPLSWYGDWQVSNDNGQTWQNPGGAIGNNTPSRGSKATIRQGHTMAGGDGSSAVNELHIEQGAAMMIFTQFPVNTLTVYGGANGTGALQTFGQNAGLIVNDAVTFEQDVTVPRTYYLSSPFTSLTSADGITKIALFDETSNSWGNLLTDVVNNIPNATGKGFLAQVGTANTTNKIILKGDNFNFAPVATQLQQSTDSKFNYVGNPYPAYLNGGELLSTNAAYVAPTIWQRTKGTEYYFITFNEAANIEIPEPDAGNGGVIAPLQGFWVKAKPEGIGQNLQFDLMNMGFQPSFTIFTPLKAPKQNTSAILRLQLDNGTVKDEVVFLYNENATNDWNSSKMMNNGLNIYTLNASENLVLNSRSSIEHDAETPIGVKAESGTYTFSAIKYDNFGTERAYLLDKVANTATDLSTSDYTVNFTEAYDGTERFALVFPRSGVITDLDNKAQEAFFAFVRANRITVNSDAQPGTIYIYNSMGQQVASQAISGKLTTVSTALPAGVYIVKLNNQTTKVVIK